MTNPISQYMQMRQQRCDRLFNDTETAVAAKQWDTASDYLEQFCDALEEHLAMEEEVLFPAFEAKTGLTTDVTGTMRAEHREFRSLMRRLEDACTHRDSDAFLDHSSILGFMLEEHETKEESGLYPLIDRALSSRAAELIETMRERAMEVNLS